MLNDPEFKTTQELPAVESPVASNPEKQIQHARLLMDILKGSLGNSSMVRFIFPANADNWWLLTGMGLAIAKEFAEGFGFRVSRQGLEYLKSVGEI